MSDAIRPPVGTEFAEVALALVVRGERLDEAAAEAVMGQIVRGAVAPRTAAAFALAMSTRGETVDELSGMVRAIQDAAVAVPVDDPDDLVDTCGTGGDGMDTFNVSTAAAVVAAAGGARVAKHGNRAVSSRCGSADVLAELGVDVDAGPSQVADGLRRDGIAFMAAPVFHPGFRHVAAARREIGMPSVFNLLGPLCNPARAGARVLGVPRPQAVEPMAEVLRRIGVRRAMVVHSEDGMDELSLNAAARVVELRDGEVVDYRVFPTALGLRPARQEDLTGGDAGENAAILRSVLDGEPGPRREIVLLNAAAALYVSGRADDLTDGLELASQAIDSGSAAGVLAAWAASGRTVDEAVPE